MLLISSIIFVFSLPIASFLFFFLTHKLNIWYSLLVSCEVLVLALGLFCCLILFLLVHLGKRFEKMNNHKNKKMWRFMVDVARFACFWLFIRIKVEGLDKLKVDESYVFYSNHQCYIDPLIYHTVLRKIPHATMYKKAIDKYVFAGPMVRALGGEAIDRLDDRSSLVTVLNIIKKVKEGLNFFIFPEGTRSRGIGLHHFKPGAFKIAQKTNAKLVLFAIDGSYRKRLTIPFIYTPVHIKLIEVINPEDLKDLNTADIARECELKVKKAQEEFRKKYFLMKPSRRYKKKFEKQKENGGIF